VAASEITGKAGVTTEPSETLSAAAPEAVHAAEVTIRKCETLEEMQACFVLQKEVWKFSDAELVPVRLFVVAAKIGGQVVGAFMHKNAERHREQELIGFALAIPGMRNGQPYLHSQMLAVHSNHRNIGLGRRLKFYQREDALARGFDLMEWTFDPLEIKNAYLNIEKLGAISRRYSVNQYGITSSPLQGGLPSDRLVAEWWMRSKRVEAAVAKIPLPAFQSRAQVDVPAEIYEWKAEPAMRSRALAVLERNREKFVQNFTEGLAILGYQRDERGNGRFLLGELDGI
jgi:predicted GNAT superfamily acetyltransferase